MADYERARLFVVNNFQLHTRFHLFSPTPVRPRARARELTKRLVATRSRHHVKRRRRQPNEQQRDDRDDAAAAAARVDRQHRRRRRGRRPRDRRAHCGGVDKHDCLHDAVSDVTCAMNVDTVDDVVFADDNEPRRRFATAADQTQFSALFVP